MSPLSLCRAAALASAALGAALAFGCDDWPRYLGVGFLALACVGNWLYDCDLYGDE